MSQQFTTLKNGLRIVTEHMPGLSSASIGIWVDAGARHETLAQNGIAHFLEHMAFKGTTTRSALQIAESIEDVGGYLNAYTSREMTAYYARVLGADVPLALDVIADILINPVFDPAEIEVERGVILQEIGQSNDTPDDIVFDWLQEAAFNDQPIGRPILGPAERVSAFTRDDLAGFVKQYYGPNQMILAAAGDVDHDALVKQAETLFADVVSRDVSPMVPATFTGGEIRRDKNLEQVHFAFAMPGPTYTDDTIFAAQIFGSALGGGMSSRLFQEVREKRGLCYSIFAQTGAFQDTGMMTIYAGTSGDDIDELSTVTMDEIKRATEDMSPSEVSRARTQMKAGMLMGLESPSNRAERLARMTAIWGRVPQLDEVVARIDSVTTGDVRAVGETMMNAAAKTAGLAMYGPVGHAPDLAALQKRIAS